MRMRFVQPCLFQKRGKRFVELARVKFQFVCTAMLTRTISSREKLAFRVGAAGLREKLLRVRSVTLCGSVEQALMLLKHILLYEISPLLDWQNPNKFTRVIASTEHQCKYPRSGVSPGFVAIPVAAGVNCGGLNPKS